MDAPPKTINVRMKAIGKIREIPVKKNPDVRKRLAAPMRRRRREDTLRGS
jgi:hypothetical protein